MIPSRARVLVAAAALAGVLGCSGGDDHPAPAGDSTGFVTTTPSVDVLRTGACADEGKSEICQIETGRAGNVVNCFRGTQRCNAGVWSLCGEGDDPDAGDAASSDH